MGQFENISYNSEFHAQIHSGDPVTWWLLLCMKLWVVTNVFELTHFYVWCKPALSFLWDIEHFLQSRKLTVYIYIYTKVIHVYCSVGVWLYRCTPILLYNVFIRLLVTPFKSTLRCEKRGATYFRDLCRLDSHAYMLHEESHSGAHLVEGIQIHTYAVM